MTSSPSHPQHRHDRATAHSGQQTFRRKGRWRMHGDGNGTGKMRAKIRIKKPTPPVSEGQIWKWRNVHTSFNDRSISWYCKPFCTSEIRACGFTLSANGNVCGSKTQSRCNFTAASPWPRHNVSGQKQRPRRIASVQSNVICGEERIDAYQFLADTYHHKRSHVSNARGYKRSEAARFGGRTSISGS